MINDFDSELSSNLGRSDLLYEFPSNIFIVELKAGEYTNDDQVKQAAIEAYDQMVHKNYDAKYSNRWEKIIGIVLVIDRKHDRARYIAEYNMAYIKQQVRNEDTDSLIKNEHFDRFHSPTPSPVKN